jgi:hypothetical protein
MSKGPKKSMRHAPFDTPVQSTGSFLAQTGNSVVVVIVDVVVVVIVVAVIVVTVAVVVDVL